MSVRTLLTAAVTVLAAVLVFVQAFQWPNSARFGGITQNHGACALLVAGLDSRSPTGLRTGDLISLPAMSAIDRAAVVYHYALLHAVPTGREIAMPIARAGTAMNVPYRFARHEPTLVFAAQLGFKLVILSIGILVLWRGRDRAAWWLGIWCSGIAIALPDGWWGALGPTVSIFGTLLNNVLWTSLPFALYMVVESIVTSTKPVFRWWARAAMIVSLLPQLLLNVVDASAQMIRGCSITGIDPQIASALFVGSQLIVLTYFAFGYAHSKGIERTRLRWVFWAFTFSRLGVLLNLVNRLTQHPLQLNGIEWLTIVIFPLGCAYAILRHRLIDVNFVLNRTLVYSALTSIIVVVFILLEDFFNSIAVSRGVGLITEVTVALAIGISFNGLHKRVEHLLDRTLFRARYDAARQLQALAKDAPYIESREALIERAITDIPRFVQSEGAAIYEQTEHGYRLIGSSLPRALPGDVDADDYAFVRLRRRLSHVDLSEVKSRLGSGGIAFALAIRGQLDGALVCGRRTNSETFSPDELSLLAHVAHEVGAELYAMRGRERDELLKAYLDRERATGL